MVSLSSSGATKRKLISETLKQNLKNIKFNCSELRIGFKTIETNFFCIPRFSADFPQLPKIFLDAINLERYNPHRCWHSRWESNPDLRFRRPMFYPLNYRSVNRHKILKPLSGQIEYYPQLSEALVVKDFQYLIIFKLFPKRY